jgi:hypothetical protein
MFLKRPNNEVQLERGDTMTTQHSVRAGGTTKNRGLRIALIAAATGALLAAPVIVFANSTPKSSAAAAVLGSASSKLAATTDTVPRSNQFLYERIRFGSGQVGTFWLSIDGTHDGLMDRPDLGSGRMLIPGCKNGHASIVMGSQVVPGKTMFCKPQPAYNSFLPTDVSAAKALLQSGNTPNATPAVSNGKTLADLLEFSWLSKAQRVALLNAASKLPSLKVAQLQASSVTGAAGALQIGWSDGAGRSGGIRVDSATYQFIGFANGGDTVEQRAIVSAAGQLP